MVSCRKFQRLRDIATTLHNNENKLKAQVAELQNKLKTKGEQIKELLMSVEKSLDK